MTQDPHTKAEALALARSTIENQIGGQRAHILSKALIEQAQEIERLRDSLTEIECWGTHTLAFSIDYGSNGVRDFYRNIARAALKEVK